MRTTTMGRWLLAALLLAAATGCDSGSPGAGATTPDPADDPRPGAHLLTMSWADREREYLVDAPEGYDPARPTPLLVVLHGRPSSAFEVRGDSGMEAFAAKHGMLVAYPEGVAQSWSGEKINDTFDDVGFIKAMVAHLVKVWNADPARVYASGFSAGASMSYRLAAEAADVFAAIAPVTGPFLGAPETVTPSAPVSVVAVLGMDDSAWRDRTVSGLETWREALGCPAGAAEPVADSPGVVRIPARCRDGSEVVEYRIDGLGHSWPPADVFGLDVNEELWRFLTAHTRTR